MFVECPVTKSNPVMTPDATVQPTPGSHRGFHRRRRLLWVVLVATASVAGSAWAWRSYRRVALWREARFAAGAGDWVATERSLNRLASYQRLETDSLRLRIKAAIHRNDRATAASLFGQLEGSDAEIASARLEQGRLLQDLDRLGEAEGAFRAAIARSPASYAPRKALIGILGLERRGADQEAELWDLIEHAGPRTEVRAEALCLLARGGPVIPAETLRVGEDEGAALDRASRADPDNPYILAALAFFLRNRGKLDEARRLLTPWFLEHGDEPPVGDEYLALLLDEGRADEAGELLGTTDGPGDSHAASGRRSLLRGVWQSMRGRHADATKAFRLAVLDDPKDHEPRYRLAQALRAVGRPEEAEPAQAWVETARALRQVAAHIDYAVPDPAAVSHAAELCRAMGRVREADAWSSVAAARVISPSKAAAPLTLP
jgi:tetratricopeptide (TPR) repeat protein